MVKMYNTKYLSGRLRREGDITDCQLLGLLPIARYMIVLMLCTQILQTTLEG